ncbi:MAG: helicase, partial [Chloroflexaceae bacterium]|nr:helicase [Chloroflexaceae bacterium]
LPWVGQSGALLGGADRHDGRGFYGAAEPRLGQPLSQPLPPPDLIIQDELHLITGPLGTMAGLYETAIDALCTRVIDGRHVGPKIIASTATVRRAQDQILALFGRAPTHIFPPPGPDRRDSFFARTAPSDETPARQYIGVAAQGRSPKVMMRKA